MPALVAVIHVLAASNSWKNVDGRVIGERSDAVVRTIMPGHGEELGIPLPVVREVERPTPSPCKGRVGAGSTCAGFAVKTPTRSLRDRPPTFRGRFVPAPLAPSPCARAASDVLRAAST